MTTTARRSRGDSPRHHLPNQTPTMMTDTRRTRIDSPIGPLTLGSEGERLTLLHMDSPRPARGRRAPESVYADSPGEDAGEVLREAARQLDAYFAGRLRAFDLPLAPRGTPFQRRVWEALREIPYGRTLGYGELAERIGAPGAARAVGLANGQNPIGIVVPCHRVIGADGRLTGYAGGIERKKFLLELEGKVVGRAEQLSFT